MRLSITQAIFSDVVDEFADDDVEISMRDQITPLPPEELARLAADSDGLVTLLTDRIDAAFLEANRHLKVVANVAVGFDNIDVPAATALGIPVTNTPGVLVEATADLAWALLLGAARRVPEADRYLREGRYRQWEIRQEHLGVDVYGATLGIFGLGEIGRAVARRASHGFAMEVLYYDVVRLDAEEEEALGVGFVEFDELLARSDFISLHAPLVPATRHAFGAEQFERMKPSAILVNTARGPLVDEAALADALERGVIRGAALDVYEREPAVDPGLLEQTESVVLLPHLGSATERTRREMCRMALRNALAALHGERPETPVNPEVFG